MNFIFNPDFAYLALIMGLLLVFLAVIIPGTGVVELLALAVLLIAAVSMYNLTINLIAVAILLLSIFPFYMAVRHSGKKIYLLIAVIALGLGSAFIFKGEGFLPAVNPFLAVITSVFSAGFIWLVLEKGFEASRSVPVQDLRNLIGKTGEAETDILDEGTVHVAGELWSARSERLIPEGSIIRVIDRDGFTLIVEEIRNKRLNEVTGNQPVEKPDKEIPIE